MRISVAMTTYNGEKNIESQLSSILNQSRMIDEIIIGDDSSTDETVEIIKKSLRNCKSDIVLLESKENKGLNINMRNVLAHTTGDIIIFADQDDIWHVDKVKRIEETFKCTNSVKGLLTGFKCIDTDGNIIFSQTDTDDNVWLADLPIQGLTEISLESIIQYNRGPGCTLAVTHDVVDIYLCSELKLIHDWQCCIISAMTGKLFYLPEVLTYYRQGNNTIGFPLVSRTTENTSTKAKFKQLLGSAKYWLFDMKQEDNNLAVVHISAKKIEKIEEACHTQVEDRITEYLNFERGLTEALTKRNLFKYLYIRLKYKKQVFNQTCIYTFWNRCDWTFRHLRIILDKNFMKSVL